MKLAAVDSALVGVMAADMALIGVSLSFLICPPVSAEAALMEAVDAKGGHATAGEDEALEKALPLPHFCADLGARGAVPLHAGAEAIAGFELPWLSPFLTAWG